MKFVLLITKNQIRYLITFITLLCPAVFGSQDIDEKIKEKFLAKITHQIIDKWQYSPKTINDEYSELVYKLYLDRMDRDKKYFLLDDIIEFDNYASKLDDLLLEENAEFFNLAISRWKKRMTSVKLYINSLEFSSIDFNIDEYFELDSDKRDYLKTVEQINEDWRKRIKYQILRKYWGLFSIENDSSNLAFSGKINGELLQQAYETEMRTINRRIDRLINQDRDELFSIYINSHTQTFDPHTSYFMPENKEDFDISISGRLEGIGARLSEDDGFIKVVDIIPGGAAWRQGDLEIDDLIVEVAQGDKEAVNVVEWRTRDAVKLIRGKMGSEVRLTIKRDDNSLKEISIIRDIVIIEDTYSKSLIFEHKLVDHKIGYITLPKFYHDFKNQGGRNSADDIRIELEKLVSENVDGIIFDLRNNGGGALEDVVKMAGFFIEDGPIVQVNGRNNRKKILKDIDDNIIYDGPLVVLVNQYSASASEIFASALQDYGRAMILGSTQTFGKGTVQRFINMDQFLPKDKKEYSPLGSLKLTVQKFYRVDGGSTQFNGVNPDIVLPFNTDYKEIGEKALDYPLEWDKTTKVDYKIVDRIELDYMLLSENSRERIQNSPFFNVVKERNVELGERGNKKEMPLKFSVYIEKQIQYKKEKEDYLDLLEELEKFELMEVISTLDTSTFDERSQKKEIEFNNTLQNDYYLNEGIFVLNDMINIIMEAN